jgi:hypothetical protein
MPFLPNLRATRPKHQHNVSTLTVLRNCLGRRGSPRPQIAPNKPGHSISTGPSRTTLPSRISPMHIGRIKMALGGGKTLLVHTTPYLGIQPCLIEAAACTASH